jgi:hypothetical protein
MNSVNSDNPALKIAYVETPLKFTARIGPKAYITHRYPILHHQYKDAISILKRNNYIEYATMLEKIVDSIIPFEPYSEEYTLIYNVFATDKDKAEKLFENAKFYNNNKQNIVPIVKFATQLKELEAEKRYKKNLEMVYYGHPELRKQKELKEQEVLKAQEELDTIFRINEEAKNKDNISTESIPIEKGRRIKSLIKNIIYILLIILVILVILYVFRKNLGLSTVNSKTKKQK